MHTSSNHQDEWVVELISGESGKAVTTIATHFRLRHKYTGCLLRASRSMMPHWANKMEEVVCQRYPAPLWPTTHWNVHAQNNPALPTVKYSNLPVSFWRNFADLHYYMWNTNNAVSVEVGKEPPDQTNSYPYQWPFMLTAMRMHTWKDTDIKFLMISNPAVVWGATGSLFTLSFTFAFACLRSRRGIVYSKGTICVPSQLLRVSTR